MFLLNRKKLKIRSEKDEEGIKTFVEYYGVKQKNIFKVNVLSELIGDDLCLGVLDSRLLFVETQEKSKITFEEILEYFDSTSVSYKKIEIKKMPEVSMFGMTIKKGSKKTERDYVIGFVMNKDNLKRIEEYIYRFNLYYFIDKSGLSEEALLKKLEENYEDLDEMNKNFYCQIFNNNFNDQLVVSSVDESAEEIKEIINKSYLELQ